MMRLFIVLGLCLLSAIGISQRSFEAGLLAGGLASQISGDRLAGFNKAGFQVGGFIQIPLSDRISGNIELYYITKGSQKPTSRDNPNNENIFGYRFNYLEVPVLVNYAAGDLEFVAGPYFSVLTKSAYVSNGIEFEIPVGPDVPQSNSDIGFISGVGYNLSEKLHVHLRYSQSILPIVDFNDNVPTQALDGGMYHSALHLMLRYHFTSN